MLKDNNNKIQFTGKGAGNTTFTISSEGKELYKININVNENNNNSTSNLAPVANNANTPENNNNSNNNNNQNNTDPNVTKDMPTIKLNVNKDYTINPYNYITKDYKYKKLHFNIANTSVATSTLDKQTKLIKFTGVGNGNTIFTISSEGKDLYKINVIVDDKNIVGTSNLDPISNNANTPDNANNNNSNNNSNIGKPNIEPTPIKPVPDNNNNNSNSNNNNNSSSNNSSSTTNYDKYIPTTNTDRYVPNSSSSNNNNNNVSGPIIGSNDRETTTTPNPPTSDPLAETGYYTPKGETPDKPNNVDISKNPNTKPVNPTPKPNTVKPNIIPKSGLDYTIYGAIVLAIGFVAFTANKYFKYNKMVKDQKSVK